MACPCEKIINFLTDKCKYFKDEVQANLLVEFYIGGFLVNTFLIMIKISAAH